MVPRARCAQEVSHIAQIIYDDFFCTFFLFNNNKPLNETLTHTFDYFVIFLSRKIQTWGRESNKCLTLDKHINAVSTSTPCKNMVRVSGKLFPSAALNL